MKRVVTVLLVSLSLFALLLSVRNYRGVSATHDEILAYQLDPQQSVKVPIYGGVSRVVMSTWLLLPFGASDIELYPYSLDVELFSETGSLRSTRRYETRTRVHLPHVTQDGEESFIARLADGRALAADPRTAELDVSALEGRPGSLLLRIPKGEGFTVLVRLSYREERSAMESQIVERTLGKDQREGLTAYRSSLGFFDIPESLRASAVGFRQRRLTAFGREGKDYKSRRLLIGNELPEPPKEGWERDAVKLGPERRVAFNVKGPLALHVTAPPGSQLFAISRGTQTQHKVNSEGQLELEFPGVIPRTIVIGAKSELEATFTADASQASTFIGEPLIELFGERIAVGPDVLRLPYFQLAPKNAVRYQISSKQRFVKVAARARTADAHKSAQLQAEWLNSAGRPVHRANLVFKAPVSNFESLDGAPVTEAQEGKLLVPNGAVELALTGSPALLVSLNTPEPLVEESVLAPEYTAALKETEHWRFARYDTKSWAVLRPNNADELEALGRRFLIEAQARIEDLTQDADAIAEQVLEPAQFERVRNVLIPSYYTARYAVPHNAWTAFTQDKPSRALTFKSHTQTSLLYLIQESQLGQFWSVSLDGTPLFSEPLLSIGGERSIPISKPNHLVSVQGLGPAGFVLVRGVPSEGGAILKRQKVYELHQGNALRFAFQRAEGQLLSVIFVLVSEEANADLALHYRVDGGKSLPLPDSFLKRTTDLKGRLSLRTGELGRARVWDGARKVVDGPPQDLRQQELLSDRRGSALVLLGDDLQAGPHTITLSLEQQPSSAVWARAILAGRNVPDLYH